MRIVRALARGLFAFWILPVVPAAVAGPATDGAAQPTVIAVAGTFALVEKFDYPWLAGLQYRSTPRMSWALRPGIGAAAGPDGMGYAYVDVARDFALPRRWTMTLSLAGGLFLNGDAIGANEPLEFMSGIAIARELPSGVRLGLAVHHVSNGGLAHPNNGSEALALFVAAPLRRSR